MHDRARFLSALEKDIRKDSRPSLVAGDWNISSTRERGKLRDWSDSLGLKELQTKFEFLNCIELMSFTRGNSSSRLDRIFVSKGLAGDDLKFFVNPNSDHHGLKFTIKIDGASFPTFQRKKFTSFLAFRPKCWLLSPTKIKDVIKESILSLDIVKNDFSPPKYWLILKLLIKQKVLQAQHEVTKNLFDKYNILKEEIDQMINVFNSDILLLQKKKNSMNVIMSKINRIQKPQTNLMYKEGNLTFLKNLFAKYKKSSINPLFQGLSNAVSLEKIIFGGQNIAEALKEEYTSRATTKTMNGNNSLLFPVNSRSHKFFSVKNNIVSSEDLDSLNSVISYEEYREALRDKSHSSLPGPDGLNSYFYSIADDDLIKIVYRARIYDDISDKEPCTDPNITALLFPIPKRSASGDSFLWHDVVDSSQVRFIALINNDSKAWARLLNVKINSILASVVHRHCFSTPHHNIQQAVLLMEYISNVKHIAPSDKSTILKLDFNNAFDLTSLSHVLNYLQSLIGRGWLHDQIAKHIQNRRVSVKFSNYTSKPMSLTVGLLQGCPLSASLYTIYMNLLASKMIKFLRGIMIGDSNCSIKVIHFIDDMVIVCRDNDDVMMAWKILKEFCLSTGAKLNVSKSEALPIHLKTNINGKSVVKGAERVLSNSKLYGMYPFGNQSLASIRIFEKILGQIDIQLARQKIHASSLSSKVKLINSLFTSKLVYFLPLMRVSNKMVSSYNSKILKFLWRGLIQVPLKLLSLPKVCGGLGLIDIKTLSLSLKLNFYVKLLENSHFTTPVKQILAGYFFKIHIKSEHFLNKIRADDNNPAILLNRISHALVSNFLAIQNGFLKLPSQFYKYFRKLPEYGGLKSFVFKVIWNRLPTAYHLRNFRHFSTINDICLSCRDQMPETLSHLMFDCENARRLRSIISKKLSLSKFSLPNDFDVLSWDNKSVPFQLLNLLIMQAIWKERNVRLFSANLNPMSPFQHFQGLLKLFCSSNKKYSVFKILPDSFCKLLLD